MTTGVTIRDRITNFPLQLRVLCSDGAIRNTVYVSSKGADTFFSIPCRVRVRGVTVSGYASIQALHPDPHVTVENPDVLKFTAEGKNASRLPDGAYDSIKHSTVRMVNPSEVEYAPG